MHVCMKEEREWIYVFPKSITWNLKKIVQLTVTPKQKHDLVNMFLKRLYKVLTNSDICFSAKLFQQHVNPCRVILCQEIKELHSVYIHTYIFCVIIFVVLLNMNNFKTDQFDP